MPPTVQQQVDILASAARSPVGAAFAAAVASARQKVSGNRPPQPIQSLVLPPPDIDLQAIEQLFAPATSTNNTPLFTAFLQWVATSCGLATGKAVVGDVFVGEMNNEMGAALPRIDMKTTEAVLFINYVNNGNVSSASFALCKPRMTLSPSGKASAAWSVFSKEEPNQAYIAHLRTLIQDWEATVLWVPATYDSLASLVNDVLVHLVYEGRPPSHALWSGGEVPRALAMAGLHTLGDKKFYATVELLNTCGWSKKPSKAFITNPGAPPPIPLGMDKGDFEDLYGVGSGDSEEEAESSAKRRKKTTTWATNTEKILKVYKGRFWTSSSPTSLLGAISKNEKTAWSFLNTAKVDNPGWTPKASLENMAYAFLGQLLKPSAQMFDQTVQGNVDLMKAFKESCESIDLSEVDLDKVADIVASSIFYGMFFGLLNTSKRTGDPYADLLGEDGQAETDFLYLAAAHGLDQFVDLQGFETGLDRALAGVATTESRPETASKGAFDVLSIVGDFVHGQRELLGWNDGTQFTTIGAMYMNTTADQASKDTVLRAVFRTVALSAMLMVLSKDADDAEVASTDNPILTMSWNVGSDSTFVPRMGHFWINKKISGGRRASTVAKSALTALHSFGKSDDPTVATVEKSIPMAAPKPAPKPKPAPQPKPQQSKPPAPQPGQAPTPGPSPMPAPRPQVPTPGASRLSGPDMVLILEDVMAKVSDFGSTIEAFGELLNTPTTNPNEVVDALEEARPWLPLVNKADGTAQAIISNLGRVVASMNQMK